MLLAQPTQEQMDGAAGFAVQLVEVLGGLGAGLAIALENLFPPLPSEVVLPLTGFAAARGVLSVPSALAWTTAGSVVGAVTIYGVGAWLGRGRLVSLWTRLPLMDEEDLTRSEKWFARHGRAAVFLGRMVPGVRSLISLPAGVERMPMLQFLLYTTAGSLLWNLLLIMAGYVLGDRWQMVSIWAGRWSTVLLVVLALAMIAFVVIRVRRPHDDQRPAPDQPGDQSGP